MYKRLYYILPGSVLTDLMQGLNQQLLNPELPIDPIQISPTNLTLKIDLKFQMSDKKPKSINGRTNAEYFLDNSD